MRTRIALEAEMASVMEAYDIALARLIKAQRQMEAAEAECRHLTERRTVLWLDIEAQKEEPAP